jgi:hypothetical protein
MPNGYLYFETPDGTIRRVKIQHWAVPEGVEFGPAHNESWPHTDNPHHPATIEPLDASAETVPGQWEIVGRRTGIAPQNTSRQAPPPA